MALRPPNLGIAQQLSSSGPANRRANPGEVPGEVEEANEKPPPDELLSKPKIPRTPADGQGRGRRTDQDVPQQEEEVPTVKIKGEPVTDETKLKEFGEGFGAREKIARTPSRERRAQAEKEIQDRMNTYNQYD